MTSFLHETDQKQLAIERLKPLFSGKSILVIESRDFCSLLEGQLRLVNAGKIFTVSLMTEDIDLLRRKVSQIVNVGKIDGIIFHLSNIALQGMLTSIYYNYPKIQILLLEPEYKNLNTATMYSNLSELECPSFRTIQKDVLTTFDFGQPGSAIVVMGDMLSKAQE